MSGSNFLLGVLLARVLSIEIFGQYALLWMVALFFLSLQQSLIVSPLYTLEAKRGDNNLHHISNAIAMQIFFAFLSMFLVILISIIFSLFQEKWNMGLLIIPFSLAVFSYLLQDFARRLLFFHGEYMVVIFINIIAYIGLLLTLFIVSSFVSLNLMIVFSIFAFTFLLSFLVAYLKMGYTHLKISNMESTFQEYWHFSKWLGLSNILQWLSGNLFIVIGGYVLGAWSVAIIRILQNTMGIFNVLFATIENYVPISAAKIYKKEGHKSLLSYIYKYSFIGIILFSLWTMLFMIITPERLIFLIYGNKYIQYSDLMYWYMAIYILMYFGMLIKFVLRTIESTKDIYRANIYMSVFSIIFAYPMIVYFELKGIVLGILLTQVIMFLFYLIVVKRKIVT